MMPGFWENDALVEAPAPAPAVAAGGGRGFWEQDALADAAPAAPQASEADRAMTALKPFFDKGVSTRNSAGQWTGEARALLTKQGLNPDAIDQKAERALLSSYEAGQQNESDGPAAVGRGLINGVPVVGPALLSGANKAAAFVRAVQRGTKYDDELKNVEGYGSRLAKENPTTTTLSELGGGVLGTAPLVAAAPAAFGAGTAGLGLRSAASLGSGLLLGGADSAARSDGDAHEAGKGAAIGAVVGGLAPGAGALVGKGVNAAVGALAARNARVPGVGNQAAGRLAEDLKNSGGADAVQARLAELGPEAMLLDASPSFEGRAQGLAVRPETRETIAKPLVERNRATNERLANSVNDAIGPDKSPQIATDEILARRRAETAPLYKQTFAGAPDVDPSDVISVIARHNETAEGAEKAALARVRSMFVEAPATEGTPAQRVAKELPNGRVWETTPAVPAKPEVLKSDAERLHNIKGEIDSLIKYGDPSLGVPAGSLNREQGALRDVRAALNETLRDQVPGYAAANDRSRELARAAGAIETGTSILDGGKAALRPADLAHLMANMGPEELSGLRLGARAEVGRQTGTMTNDLQALKNAVKGEGDWNRGKLELVFGKNDADRIFNAVDREAAFREAYNRITQNSQTAQRTAAANDMSVRDLMPGENTSNVTLAGLIGGRSGAAAALGMKGLKLGANAAGRAADIARNKEAASILTMGAGPERDALIAALNARLEAASRGEIPASSMDRFVRQILQSVNDRSDRSDRAARAAISPR